MKKLFVIFALLAPVSSVVFAATNLVSMNQSQTTKAISDKTITTIPAVTIDGKVISDIFTCYFGANGKMNGKFAAKQADGPQVDQGTWIVKPDGMMCTTWEHWNHAKEKCVSLYKLNNALLFADSDLNFKSLVLNSEVKSGNQM